MGRVGRESGGQLRREGETGVSDSIIVTIITPVFTVRVENFEGGKFRAIQDCVLFRNFLPVRYCSPY